ncbi:hypothetical protein Tco_1274747 [Tanacetum coccineum]
MNSYTFMGLDDVEEGEEISSRKKSFIKRAIAYIKMRRQTTRVPRNSITRDRAGAHERLVVSFFTETPSNPDCTGREGISPLIKCTSAIRQLAYGVNASFLDEYMQISERSSRTLDSFCQAVMEIYGPEYLRKPTVTDVEKLYRHHEAKHGFPGMLGSLDCTDWEWFLAVLTRLKGNIYLSGYYLVDGIYPKLAPLVKTIPEPTNDDHKRILYKQKQGSARKDVERAFGASVKWDKASLPGTNNVACVGRKLDVEEVGKVAFDVGLKRILAHVAKSPAPINASIMFFSCSCWMYGEFGGGGGGGGVVVCGGGSGSDGDGDGEWWLREEMWRRLVVRATVVMRKLKKYFDMMTEASNLVRIVIMICVIIEV